MATRVVRMEGFDQLERNLQQLKKATGKNVLRRVSKGALEPMADRAAANAPVETGRLAFSIAVSEGRTGRAKRSTTRFVGGRFRADPSTGIEMAMGPASGFGAALNYATFTEFGTIDTPAFAYMRSAWSFGAVKALRYVKDNLGLEIDKAVKKMLVKRAKAGL
jgi:HK97 gp10 family phage protein